jgi:hypothetical protein
MWFDNTNKEIRPSRFTTWSMITPTCSSTQIFISPYNRSTPRCTLAVFSATPKMRNMVRTCIYDFKIRSRIRQLLTLYSFFDRRYNTLYICDRLRLKSQINRVIFVSLSCCDNFVTKKTIVTGGVYQRNFFLWWKAKKVITFFFLQSTPFKWSPRSNLSATVLHCISSISVYKESP